MYPILYRVQYTLWISLAFALVAIHNNKNLNRTKSRVLSLSPILPQISQTACFLQTFFFLGGYNTIEFVRVKAWSRLGRPQKNGVRFFNKIQGWIFDPRSCGFVNFKETKNPKRDFFVMTTL